MLNCKEIFWKSSAEFTFTERLRNIRGTFVLGIYLKGRYPVGEWASERDFLKTFIGALDHKY